MGRLLGWIALDLIGAFILSPAVAMIGLDPLPGDFHLTLGNTHLYLPLATSFIVCVCLTLLFFLYRR
jgi:hypothetical protein